MNFTTKTLVTITAPTCSGKNFLREQLEERLNFDRVISTTTRPARTGELDGRDYYFISQEQSKYLEDNYKFAELITFRGTRYGITFDEMRGKMASNKTPCIILEPEGLHQYQHLCRENGWNLFSIYVHTPESTRIDRLIQRSVADIKAGQDVQKTLAVHTDRIQSILGDERRWMNFHHWSAIVPGDDLEKALQMVQVGIKWANRRAEEPAEFV